METAYFRFVQQEKEKGAVYATGFISLMGTTVLLSGLLIFWRQPLADFMEISANPEWIT
ncbi:MAG: hypothetical protein ACXWV0_03195 [Flavisolibacter sp.]